MALQCSLTRKTTSRGLYLCDLCELWISPGERYLRWAIFGRDTVQTVRVHPLCEECARGEDWYPGEWPTFYPLSQWMA